MDGKWTKLTLEVPRELVEPVSSILEDYGSNGVEIIDSADYISFEEGFGEVLPDISQIDQVKVSAYYADISQEDINQIKAQVIKLREFGFDFADFDLTTEFVIEEDWAENWKKYYEPIRLTRDLTIVPSWIEYTVSHPEEKVIRLDPGMAFGTGTHPTTKLSLYAMEQVIRGGERVLDVGTGSGVLSIAASILGASQIFAYDLDQVAVQVAQKNMNLNPGATHVQIFTNHLLQGVAITGDLIVANILADILLLLLEDAYRILKWQGYLILSGITKARLAEVLERSLDLGFKLETQLSQGQWYCLILKKQEEAFTFG